MYEFFALKIDLIFIHYIVKFSANTILMVSECCFLRLWVNFRSAN